MNAPPGVPDWGTLGLAEAAGGAADAAPKVKTPVLLVEAPNTPAPRN